MEQGRRNIIHQLPDVVQNTQQGKGKSVMDAVQPEEIGEIEKESGSLTKHWMDLKKYNNFGG